MVVSGRDAGGRDVRQWGLARPDSEDETMCGFLRLRPRIAALLSTVVLTTVVSSVFATSSMASDPSLFCPPPSAFTTPFAWWGDWSSYVLAPDGGLEGGGLGWTFEGGASVRFGNEPFYVHGFFDSRRLDLPAGSSATTPPLCIDASYPTMRFFLSGLWSGGSKLTVEALYVDAYGVASWHKLGSIGTTGGWQAVKAIKLPDKIESPSVQFRFSVSGGFGGYQLDDLYVDPYIRV
jgi:hypothetical protein